MQPLEALTWPGSACQLSAATYCGQGIATRCSRLMPNMVSLCRLINSQSLMLGQEPTADHLQSGPPEQAQHPGPYTWPQQVPALILDFECAHTIFKQHPCLISRICKASGCSRPRICQWRAASDIHAHEDSCKSMVCCDCKHYTRVAITYWKDELEEKILSVHRSLSLQYLVELCGLELWLLCDAGTGTTASRSCTGRRGAGEDAEDPEESLSDVLTGLS